MLIIAAKMFTTGRIIFASGFIIAFVSFMIFSYIKDAKNNRIHYKNAATYVAIVLLVLLGLLFLSKYLIKHYNG